MADDTPSTTTTTPTDNRFVEAVLAKITLTDETVAKRDSFAAEPVDGSGVVVAEITSIQQINPGLPDYYISVSVMGQTFLSEDPDRAIIGQIFDDCMKSVAALVPADLTTGLKGGAVVGIQQITQAAITSNDKESKFAIDFRVVACDVVF